MEPYYICRSRNEITKTRTGLCPHCHAKTGWSITELQTFLNCTRPFPISIQCQVCKNYFYDICSLNNENRYDVKYELRRIWPIATPSSIPAPNPDMPEECKAIYNEAAQVSIFSPRSAAALLRLCLQNLLQIANVPGDNINDQIRHLVRTRLSSKDVRCMDICRIIGNEGVHPGEINFEENPAIIPPLFLLINLATSRLFTDERIEDELYKLLPTEKRKGVEERNAKIEADKTATE